VRVEAALAREREVFEQITSVPSSDPQRREALHALRAELVAARDPLLPHVRGSGRLYGRRGDPIREAHAALRAAIRRVDSRLRPTSGNRRPPARPIPASSATPRAAARAAYGSLLGSLNQSKGALKSSRKVFDAMREVVGGGEAFKGMSTYREEARELIQPLVDGRRRLRDRLGAYRAAVLELRREVRRAYDAGRPTKSKHAAYLRHEERLMALTREVEAFIAASRSFEAQLYRAARRTRPFRRARGDRARAIQRGPVRRLSDWRYGAARAAVEAFADEHGRMPTKRECNALPELPPYTTLHREFGSNPLAQLDRLRADNHKTEGIEHERNRES